MTQHDHSTVEKLTDDLINNSEFNHIESSSDSLFCRGIRDVIAILQSKDKKAEFIVFSNHILVHLQSALGPNAYYPLLSVELSKPVQAILMDLDGTTAVSENFWIEIIRRTICQLIDNPKFTLETADIPYIIGHSVSEHLSYCITKYCPDKILSQALNNYYTVFEECMRNSTLKPEPTPGLKKFLIGIKQKGIKLGLVTSGLYEKAYPEIMSVFNAIGCGDPKDFYDVIITAGYRLGKGRFGTLGELTPKPHPWLYAEAGVIGLSIPFDSRSSVIGIDDSSAGICSIRLAGFNSIGMSWGNIKQGGMFPLCNYYFENFEQILDIL